MGGGVETAFDNNWSAKFKALYVDLAGSDATFGGASISPATTWGF